MSDERIKFRSYGGIGWNSSVPLLNLRNHLESAVLGGKLYALSSQYSQDGNSITQTAHVESCQIKHGTVVARLSRPRSHIGAATFVMNGRSFVTGSEIRYGELFTSSSVKSKGHRPE